ncbi:MAG: hypothetical protein GXP63_01685 [DPANN group archaeon]|nr:hypothetical protein [DPANN group archaeon]
MNQRFVLFLLVVSLSSAAVLGQPSAETGIQLETAFVGPDIWLHQDGCSVFHSNAHGNLELVERAGSYAFEGEQIICPVLVHDANGVEDIKDVYMALAPDRGIETRCDLESDAVNASAYNALVNGLPVSFDPLTMQAYLCTFTVETAGSMQGQFYLGMYVVDLENASDHVDESSYWYFNPDVSVTLTGSIDFGTVSPGSNAYSTSLTIENTASAGSGVFLDMYISGSDFYDPTSFGSLCPTSNVLTLDRFAYYASNGGYHTQTNNSRENPIGGLEGYYTIPYETGHPADREQIIEGAGILNISGKLFEAGNVLAPGAELTMDFRLALPEPCIGDFDDGQMFFWGVPI